LSVEKWILTGIDKNSIFYLAAKSTLTNRNNTLCEKIKTYLDVSTVENLHEVRIAFRRLRYSLEVFAACFPTKEYGKFYNSIEKLQDRTGMRRDLDVIKFYLSGKVTGNKSKGLIAKIEQENNVLGEEIKLELMAFLHSKNLKKFINLLSK
jgi:CHAD domain-containing protein